MQSDFNPDWDELDIEEYRSAQDSKPRRAFPFPQPN